MCACGACVCVCVHVCPRSSSYLWSMQEIDPAGAVEHQRAVGGFLNEPGGLA